MYIMVLVYLVSGLGFKFVLIPLDMSYIYLVYLVYGFIGLVRAREYILYDITMVWFGSSNALGRCRSSSLKSSVFIAFTNSIRLGFAQKKSWLKSY